MIKYNFENKNTITVLILPTVVVLLVSLIVWLGTDINNKLSESENVITVSATSEVYAKPDLALTTFSVITEAKTVGKAMDVDLPWWDWERILWHGKPRDVALF